MWAMSCVERYLTVFSFDGNNGNKIDRICEVNRVLGVSGKDWVSSIPSSGTQAASADSENLPRQRIDIDSDIFLTFFRRMAKK